MNKRQARRLLNVAKALRESPVPEAFDMGRYIHTADQTLNILGIDYDIDPRNGNLLKDNEHISEKNFCGTPACALGHYAVRSDLQQLMTVEGQRFNNFYGSPHLAYKDTACRANYDDPDILYHFGISYDQAVELFDGDGCGGAETPIQAARYIEKFVRKHYGEL